MSVGQRKDFLSGLLHSGRGTKTNFNTSLMSSNLASNRKSKRNVVELPGINHAVGSLNGFRRKVEFDRVSKQNMALAKKLIDTRSIISYDK